MLHPSLVQVMEDSEGAKDDSPDDVNIDALITKYTEGADGGDTGPSAVFAEGVLGRLQEADRQECAVCFDLMELPVLVPDCLHAWWVNMCL